MKVFLGLRQSLPNDAYPSLEIEAADGSTEWYACRTQMATYNLRFTLTTSANSKVEEHIRFNNGLTMMIVGILTSPENLQLTVLNETRWNPNGGLIATTIVDSLVSNVTFTAFAEGTIRVAEFDWFCKILQPYPDLKFKIGESTTPTVIIPKNV